MATPSLKQLRYFVALEQYQHFGKAAEACYVSQSAFSMAIKELEGILGIQLVDRTQRHVTITHVGKAVATQARVVLRDLDNLQHYANSYSEPLSGRLELGIIPTIAPFLLPRILPKIRAHFPKLDIYLREDLTQRLHERLMEGELDVILLALPYELRYVETRVLFNDGFRLACHHNTTHINPVYYHLEQVNAESILLLEDGHCLRDHALLACQIRNLDKINRFGVSSLLTLIHMVDADLGITFLPEMAEGSPLLAGTQIRTYALQEEGQREIALAWRQGSARAEAFGLLGEVIGKSYLV
ncbi:LysR substrate-binding domain-containing protein [Thioflexithrix psekupsensis]|uniref:LysR family transcriptional regulator n=1 Tax=Thioflexithrix psekupsensis TaxID=1570016 RepID=A0A251XAR2_9GAMM|nr:LysR substrate-binding domain-containing protein [Thioflexithrix psekupsensis]OUD15522.1 LysR family transcriptional regulator [Thioflexithrix psekupsensis]